MLLRQKLAAFFICTILILAVTTEPVSANTPATESREVLFAQIERLVVEVTKLQTLLLDLQKKKQGETPATNYTPYSSVLFPLVFESTYLIENGRLHSLVPGKLTAAADAKLFQLFVDALGAENVNKYVKEWRVFYNSKSDLGAFTEYIPAANAWLVGVNREGFVARDEEITESFANLFVHEFAHIVLFEKPDFETNFTENFWTAADSNHSAKVEQTAATVRFTVLSRYYENNATRFVSDYATLNPSEDIAETFLAFVREEKPLGLSVREQKIRTFYTDTDFVVLRGVLRANLIALGAL